MYPTVIPAVISVENSEETFFSSFYFHARDNYYFVFAGIYLWCNKSLYQHLSLAPVLATAAPTLLSLPSHLLVQDLDSEVKVRSYLLRNKNLYQHLSLAPVLSTAAPTLLSLPSHLRVQDLDSEVKVRIYTKACTSSCP
jgi:hypothetical protein